MRLLVTAPGLIASVAYGTGASASAPSNTSHPSISGTAQVHAALTANSGTWTGYPTPASSFGGGCAKPGVATSPAPSPRAVSPPPVRGLLPESSKSLSVRSSRVSGGVITTVVRVPGAGRAAQVGRVRGAKGVACSSSHRSSSAGTVILICRVAARALPRKCGSSVLPSVRTTFTPTGGNASSKERVVLVRKRCPTPGVTS